MRVSIGGDHAGPALKKVLTAYLESQGVEVINRGTDSLESVDYPDHAHAVSEDVANRAVDFGILICGSANGVAMTEAVLLKQADLFAEADAIVLGVHGDGVLVDHLHPGGVGPLTEIIP